MKKLLPDLQRFFGVTRAELVFALVLLSGLSGGLILQKFFPDPEEPVRRELAEEIYRKLDSLAERNKAEFTGPDSAAGPAIAADSVSRRGIFPEKEKKSVPSGKIELNSAPRAELMTLPGVGGSTADKIIEYRSRRPFSTPEDIMNIRGIGEKKFEKMQQYITVEQR